MRDNRHEPPGHPFGGEPRARHNGSNGNSPKGMQTRSAPLDTAAEPVDLVAVQADDELIGALSSGMSVNAPGVDGYDADDRVTAILAAWKAEVDSEPIPELVDLDTAVSVVLAARPPSRRARHLAPLAAAAAFIVLAIGGVSVGSYSAQPDDMLWGVSKVLYSERAESVEAAARVEERIARAKQALVEGQPAVAAQELQQAQADLAAVRPEEGQHELADVQGFLLVKAKETPPGAPADLTAPLVTQPTRPVPPGVVDGPTPPLTTDPSVLLPPGGPAGPTGGPDAAELSTQREDPLPPALELSPSATEVPGDIDHTSVVPTPTATPQPLPDGAGTTTVPGATQGQPPLGAGEGGPIGATAAGSGVPETSATS